MKYKAVVSMIVLIFLVLIITGCTNKNSESNIVVSETQPAVTTNTVKENPFGSVSSIYGENITNKNAEKKTSVIGQIEGNLSTSSAITSKSWCKPDDKVTEGGITFNVKKIVTENNIELCYAEKISQNSITQYFFSEDGLTKYMKSTASSEHGNSTASSSVSITKNKIK